jgi:2-hydroxy-3-oxopropionate reductase
VGAGNVTKLANQIMVACNIAAMGEALVLATRAGLDPEVVFNAVKGGLAGSTVLNAKAPMVIARNFKPGFRIRLHQKDLRNALLAGESMKVSLPLTSLVQQMLMALMNEGKGDLDHSAIVTFIEKMAGIEVKKDRSDRHLDLVGRGILPWGPLWGRLLAGPGRLKRRLRPRLAAPHK